VRPVFVAGVGIHSFGRFPDRTVTAIAADAVQAAMTDAEIGRGDFQAAFCGTVYSGVAAGHKVLTALGLSGVPIVNVEAGCASGGAALALGAAQVASGRHDRVLVFGMEKMPRGIIRSSFFEPWREEAGLAATPAYFALRAQRLMLESDVTVEDLARVSVKNHRHGVANPHAMYRRAMSLEEILAATGVASAPARVDSPFVVLSSRPEGDARAAQGRFSRESWQGAIGDLPNYLYDEATPRVLATPGYTAYIKIAEGCDHPCTFCIIPQLRGKFRSRRFESVVAEAERLASSGVREITLIGQDTTCYGEDFGLKDGLALLLEKLANIEELRWIRFLYAYPNKISRRLLETIAAHDKICSYIDVPLQHASPAMLKRMKRGGGADIFLRSIQEMRRTIPDVTLRTSFIVGFPGETENEFEELCEFVREAEFDWMGAFGYSDQEGAGAFSIEKKLPNREIERRRKRLMQIQRGISKKKKRALLGKELDLLLEGTSEESDLLLEGRTSMHAPEIDGKVFVTDVPEEIVPEAGQFYRCQITETHDYDLIAKILV